MSTAAKLPPPVTPPGPTNRMMPVIPGAPTLLPPEERAKVMSSGRMKRALALFIGGLLLALGLMLFLLVSHIFNWLTPSIHQDLQWKATRGVVELSQTGELGVVLRDEPMLHDAFEPYKRDGDVQAIVATDAQGKVLAKHGVWSSSVDSLFSGEQLQPHWSPAFVRAWAELSVEGKAVGRIAMVVSTERLATGENLRQRILLIIGLGCVGGLMLALSFVRFYIGPLIRVTEGALATVERTAFELAAKQRLEKELEIGARIQTCLLPRSVEIDGLEVAARMQPASEVGGDYYDFFAVARGGWIGIGDVAGHGLSSGLIMLMVQSSVASLCRKHPNASPREVVITLNNVLYDNIRHRLGNDEHVTFTLMRYFDDGRIAFAGAHEELLLCRAEDGKCRLVETPGTWLGAMKDVSRFTDDSHLQLREGDLLVLYTDGITEAMNESKEQFGLERLSALIEAAKDHPVEAIVERVFSEVRRHAREQDDDWTLLVMRYQPGESGLRPIP